MIDAANAVQDFRVEIDANRRPVFEPKPSTPKIEIGAWPGSEFEDASANSGDEIYNRIIVEGTGPDGENSSRPGRRPAARRGVRLDLFTGTRQRVVRHRYFDVGRELGHHDHPRHGGL